MAQGPNPPDVFVSHASENGDVARRIVEELESSGLRCWIAPRDIRPGIDYAEGILDGIKNSRSILLLISSASMRSPHVSREIERAVNAGTPIIPARIEDVPLTGSLEYFVGSVHGIDALTGADGRVNAGDILAAISRHMDADVSNKQTGGDHSAPGAAHRGSSPAKKDRLTFKSLTAPSAYPTQFAHSDGARIAFNERGAGPISVVLTLGIICHLNVSENLPVIRDTLDALSNFARVITFDKRGQGLSDPALRVPDFEQRSRDIAAVMDEAGLERAHVLALSEGGPMALHFAWRYPERVLGLILVGTTARFVQSEDYPIGIQRDLLELIPNVWGKGEMRDVLMPSLSRETMDDATYRAMERLIASRETARQLTETMIATDLRSILPEIRCPALVLHFVGDLAVPIRLGRALAEGLPDAEFVEVNSVDHADISQSPDAIERIRRFCERTSNQ